MTMRKTKLAHSMKAIFLSILCLVALSLNACSQATSKSQNKNTDQEGESQANKSKDYDEPKQIATLEDKNINESSGIVASRINKGIFWTHNDSGDAPFIYAFDAKGKQRGTFRVAGAQSLDWEDIAIAFDSKTNKSFLYIGDIGDNSKERESIIVYRVAEPVITAEDANSTKANARQTENAEAIRLQYPDGKHNAETVMVHPTTGDIYIVTKTQKGAAGVYKISNPSTLSTNKLIKVGDINVPSLMKGFLTGGEISSDGQRVILCDYFAAFEFVLNSNEKFDDLWNTKPLIVNLSQREQGEAVCYSTDGKAIYATSEKIPAPLIEVRRVK